MQSCVHSGVTLFRSRHTPGVEYTVLLHGVEYRNTYSIQYPFIGTERNNCLHIQLHGIEYIGCTLLLEYAWNGTVLLQSGHKTALDHCVLLLAKFKRSSVCLPPSFFVTFEVTPHPSSINFGHFLTVPTSPLKFGHFFLQTSPHLSLLAPQTCLMLKSES